MISRSRACCNLLWMSLVLIPPVLMIDILMALLGFLSIEPPMLPTVWKLAFEETLFTVIIRSRHRLDHLEFLEGL